MNESRIQTEARLFGEQDNAKQRSSAWSSIAYFQHQLRDTFDIGSVARAHLTGRRSCRALALAPGDMQGEYPFLEGLGVTAIDVIDLSPGQRGKFFAREPAPTIDVTYDIADINQVELPAKTYDVVYVQQAFHHFEALEHLAAQVNGALRDDGIFVVIDYIGANYLQRTPNQRAFCQAIWERMPERWRRDAGGRVHETLFIPRRKNLSPFEAIRAEEIETILARTLKPMASDRFAAILFPLFNGFAHNYTNDATDRAFIEKMWALDRRLIAAGDVEANFLRAIYAKR